MHRAAIWLAAVLSATAIPLTGCSGDPAAIANGTYRAMAASGELTTTPDATLTVDGGQFIFSTAGGVDIATTATPGTEQFVVCPPDATGKPDLLGPTVTVGGVAFAEPAVFGDCGQTKPERITVVDLASARVDGGPFPFTRWIEFCDTSDPDC